ncbi:MAG: O-unit flippase-like protein [Paludibacter sp.]|nr:O-unit flippase-like protein [Paludibacter sp.]
MKIGRKDIFWNYMATFMRIASGIIILPLVLKMLPTEEYGLWSIFLTISSLITLLDFGFSNSFSRNIVYVFSGVTELKAKGYVAVELKDSPIDYSLLKSVITAMKRYYGAMSLIFLVIFIVASPVYMNSVLQKYSGDKQEIWIAWFTYGVIVAYEFYTYYYNSLLTGRGLIKRNMQIIIISQSVRILVSVICLLLKMGIISMIIGMFFGDIVNRTLSYYSFYDKKIKAQIKEAIVMPVMEVMKIMAPNAFKIGLTTLGYFALTQAILLISPFYLTLSEVAEYGISKQLVSLILSIGGTWFGTFYPQLTQYRIRDENENVKRLYVKGILTVAIVFIVAGTGLLWFGNSILEMIHSKTFLLNNWILLAMLIFSFFEACQSISTSTLLTKNEVPFFKSVLISGGASLLLLFILFNFTNLGVWSMVLAPGIVLSLYHNWKWPYMVIKELNIKPHYIITISVNTLKSFKKK